MAKNDEKSSGLIPEHHLPYGPGPRAAERIFETARELFYREGIRAVGVDEIVTKAGVTKPSLYRGFKSKDDLVAAVLREVEVGFWDRFDAAEAAFPNDPKAQMIAFFEGLAARSGGADYRGCALSNGCARSDCRSPGCSSSLSSVSWGMGARMSECKGEQ